MGAGNMTASVSSLTLYARWLTIISWLTYPCVYIIKMLGISGVTATAGEQIGYSVADVVAKAVFGVLIWAIAAEKSKIEEQGLEGELLASVAMDCSERQRLEWRVRSSYLVFNSAWIFSHDSSHFPLVVVQTERSRNIASEQCMRRS